MLLILYFCTAELAPSILGVLKYREYDMYVVAQKGGIAVEHTSGDFVYDVLGLIEKLQTQKIDGFVLDKYV